MKLPFVLIFFVVLIKASGDVPQESATEVINENGTEHSYKRETTEINESEPNYSSKLQNQLISYDHELCRILKEKLQSYRDFTTRPSFYGPPVEVRAIVEIREILEISEVDMQMKLSLVLDLKWNDPDLKYEHVLPAFVQRTGVWVTASVQEQIWSPKVSILNEKDSVEHSRGFVTNLLQWNPNGAFLRRINIVTTVSCSMSLQDFPMDEQTCSILIGSPSYNDDEMKLMISPYLSPFFSNSVKNVQLLGVRISSFLQNSRWENRTVFTFQMRLRRYVGYYAIGTFFPSALIVIISWLTFWMDQDTAVDRMTLGVTCVLTITTLLISSQASSPKVSYIKAIDVYMGVCFTLVFCALLYSTAVGYFLRRMSIQTAKRKLKDAKNNVRPNQRSKGFSSVVRRCRSSGNLDANERPNARKFILKCDIWCRAIFPLMFFAFNVAYWTYYLARSGCKTENGWISPETYHNYNIFDGGL